MSKDHYTELLVQDGATFGFNEGALVNLSNNEFAAETLVENAVDSDEFAVDVIVGAESGESAAAEANFAIELT